MNAHATKPLALQIWPVAGRVPETARAVVLAVLGTLVLWASAKIQVPFWPVPATLQSLAVVMIGALYGSRLGGATLLAYLAEGAAGLTVFAGTPAKGIGLAYMAGPTGGYLLGFVAAAVLIGWLVESGFARSIVTTAAAVLAAHAVVHAFGLAWLSAFIGLEKSVEVAFVPFLAADLVKAALSTALIVAVSQRWRAR